MGVSVSGAVLWLAFAVSILNTGSIRSYMLHLVGYIAAGNPALTLISPTRPVSVPTLMPSRSNIFLAQSPWLLC